MKMMSITFMYVFICEFTTSPISLCFSGSLVFVVFVLPYIVPDDDDEDIHLLTSLLPYLLTYLLTYFLTLVLS